MYHDISRLTNDVLFQSRHSDSLALLYVLHDDYDRACYYAGNYEQNFLAVGKFVQALLCSMQFYICYLWSGTYHQHFVDLKHRRHN